MIKDGILYSVFPANYMPAIPRHGGRRTSIPQNWSRKLLPGAINVSFFDGHAQLVPLKNLWQLSWHYGYQPPASIPEDP